MTGEVCANTPFGTGLTLDITGATIVPPPQPRQELNIELLKPPTASDALTEQELREIAFEIMT